MIQFILLQNRQGKTRLSKYYRAFTDDEKVKLEGEIHRLVTTRDPKFTNFVEVRACRRTDPAAPRRAPRLWRSPLAESLQRKHATRLPPATARSSSSSSSSTGATPGSSSRFAW